MEGAGAKLSAERGGRLGNLRGLSLSNNAMTGAIPAELAEFRLRQQGMGAGRVDGAAVARLA